jgi:hypothetical protein
VFGNGNGATCHGCKVKKPLASMQQCGGYNPDSGKACLKKFCVGCQGKYVSPEESQAIMAMVDRAWVCFGCQGICVCAGCRQKRSGGGGGSLKSQQQHAAAAAAAGAALPPVPLFTSINSSGGGALAANRLQQQVQPGSASLNPTAAATPSAAAAAAAAGGGAGGGGLAGNVPRAAAAAAAAGPPAPTHVVYDLFNQVVSIQDPAFPATGFRPGFFFVMEYQVCAQGVLSLPSPH